MYVCGGVNEAWGKGWCGVCMHAWCDLSVYFNPLNFIEQLYIVVNEIFRAEIEQFIAFTELFIQ